MALPGPLTSGDQAVIVADVVAKSKNALAFFKARSADVQAYEDFDTFVDRDNDSDPKRGAKIETQLTDLRSALATALWTRQIFISVDVLDRLLFDAVKSHPTRPLEESLLALFHHGVPSAGLVVYPLHSFGVLGFGLFGFLTKVYPDFVIQDAKLAITPQTNANDASIAFVERAAKALGVTRTVDRTGLDHYLVSRPLKWFAKNPLLVVAMSTTTSGYYENQFIYVLKLKIATALVMMLSVVGKQTSSKSRLHAISTKRANNWQTLDINHYLVLEPSLSDKTRLEARCVPMNAARLQLAELSDLNADLDPVTWSSRKAVKKLDGIREALDAVERGYLEHYILGDRSKWKARVYRKLMDSIDYFRRSLSAGADDRTAAVSLATAFEALLMDRAPRGQLTKTFHRRVALALKGVPGVRKYRAAVKDLYAARSAVVHSGRSDLDVDMLLARRAYVNCLIKLAGSLGTMSNNADRPFGRLIGDVV
ncbi:MAG: hypothetical protein V4707_09500 [Pseudomonadota bacterium]